MATGGLERMFQHVSYAPNIDNFFLYYPLLLNAQRPVFSWTRRMTMGNHAGKALRGPLA